MPTDIEWTSAITNKSWFEAVVEEEGNKTNGAVESIQPGGLYMRVFDSSFRPEEQVTIGLYLRDLDRLRIHVLTVQARIVQADKRGVYFHFRPMGLSEHILLRQIIDCVSAYRGGTTCQEEVLLKEKFGLITLLV